MNEKTKGTLDKVLNAVKVVLRKMLHAVSQNLGWKVLSLLVAIFLWSYIVSSDPTITRDKTLAGVDITTSGLSVLRSRDLALLTDPTTALQGVRVRVQAPQSSFARVTNENVRVELDLSQIRQTGTQEVQLTGISAYGEVIQIVPSKLEVVVESLDQRNVPINVELIGDTGDDGYWYAIDRVNPGQMSISGPASLVQDISSAKVSMDVTGLTNDHNWTAQPVFLDSHGEEIPQSSLSKSSSTVSVSMSVYPTKQLTVNQSMETMTSGTLPEGYELVGIEVQPSIVTVAADADLLEQLETISTTPIGINGRRQSFTTTATLNKLKDIQYLSSEQVTVTVYIEEMTITRTFSEVPIRVLGLREGQKDGIERSLIDVRVSGPYSVVQNMKAEDIFLWVDTTGRPDGRYILPINAKADGFEGVEFELEYNTSVLNIG